MSNTIFIQIASYKDPQLLPTLNGITTQSDHPELIRAVVAWQHGPEDTIEDFLDAGFEVLDSKQELGDTIHVLTKNKALVELIDIHYLNTQGACWARHKIQQHYGKEKYTLQLDSHHRFVDHWDTILIDMLESVRDESPKPVLTAYVPSYDPENDPAGRVNEPWKQDFDRFIPEGTHFTRPSTIDDWRERTKPMRARFYSAHFAFADGSFAEEVQHDPEMFFHGEEVSIGIRAFTHGYDLYHPHKVVIWHEYTRKGRTKVWDDHSTQQKQKGKINKDWWERNVESHKRNRILFGVDGEDQTQIDFGKYGFGKVRTVREVEEMIGVAHKYRSVQQTVLEKTEPDFKNFKRYESEEEWLASLSKSNDIRICFPKDELKDANGEIADDYDFWYVGTHREDGTEIYRKDFQEHEIKQYMKDSNPWIDQRFIFFSDPKDVPKTYTVWTHSKSKGWLTKIDKMVDS